MGVLGFNGALVAADIAAKDVLGPAWVAPLPFVFAATVLCAKSVFAKDTFLGPEALTFFATYGGQTSRLAREQLLADLDVAYKENSGRANQKTINLRKALVALASGLVVAGSLIVAFRPTKVATDGSSHTASTAARPAAPGSGSGPVWPASSRPTRHHQVARPPASRQASGG
jgi:hypothetical protein